MALFRDRRGFPRWSFIDSRSLPRPRHAKENTVLEPPPSMAVGHEDPPAPVVKIHPALHERLGRDDDEVGATHIQAAVPVEQPEPVRPVVAELPEGYASWLDERRSWFGDDWPTEASDESVQNAATRAPRPYVARTYPGLPVDSPAEVRARHGRGFSSVSRRRRRRRHGHEVEQRRADIDLAAVEEALDRTAATVGSGLVDMVIWHATTGLPLASRGTDPVSATLWHHASLDVRASLPHADLPDRGSYHLVGLADRRLAVLVHAGPDLGACVTVALDTVSVNDLLASTIPALHASLAAASQEL